MMPSRRSLPRARAVADTAHNRLKEGMVITIEPGARPIFRAIAPPESISHCDPNNLRRVRPFRSRIPQTLPRPRNPHRGQSRGHSHAVIFFDAILKQDEVLIGKNDPVVLSVAAPKEVRLHPETLCGCFIVHAHDLCYLPCRSPTSKVHVKESWALSHFKHVDK